MNTPSDIKKNYLGLISNEILISSKAIFYKELENIKQTLINKSFPNYIVDEQIKRTIGNDNQQNKHCNAPTNKQEFIKLFTVTKWTKITNLMKIF